jgi:hypothetical protein
MSQTINERDIDVWFQLEREWVDLSAEDRLKKRQDYLNPLFINLSKQEFPRFYCSLEGLQKTSDEHEPNNKRA